MIFGTANEPSPYRMCRCSYTTCGGDACPCIQMTVRDGNGNIVKRVFTDGTVYERPPARGREG